MRLTAPAPRSPTRYRSARTRGRVLGYARRRLIEEIFTRGTLRDRIEIYRFLKGYAHGVAKLQAGSRSPGSTFEEMMEMITAAERANALETTVETVSVEQVPT